MSPTPRHAEDSWVTAAGDAETALTSEVPEDAIWLEGLVEFPSGTPADECVFVEARGRRFGGVRGAPRRHLAQVEADGRFRVAVDAKTKRAWLELSARYLYLDSKIEVRPGKSVGAIRLKAHLGGVMLGHVISESGATPEPELLAGSSVFIKQNPGTERNQRASTPVAAVGTFEFTALRHGTYKVAVQSPRLFTSPRFLGEVRRGVEVRAGEVVELQMKVLEGWQASGRITDASGAPVPLAGVDLRKLRDHEEHALPFFVTSGPATGKADRDGFFKVPNLPPGEWKIMVGAPGFALQTRRLGASSSRESLQGLEFHLSRGNHIAGRVLWPDGSPAIGVMVKTTQLWDEEHFEPGELAWQTRAMYAETDDEGAFIMHGFGSEKIEIETWGRQPSTGETEQLGEVPQGRSGRSGPVLHCLKESVDPGAEGLLFVLQPE